VDGSILWCTYLGTPGHDVMRDIDVTPSGEVYVSMRASREAPFIKSSGVLDSTKPYAGGSFDIIIAKIKPDGTAVELAGWLGGNNNDGNPVIRVSASGDLFLLMGTDSTNLPLSPAPLVPFQSTYQGDTSDMYIARFAGDLSAMRYGTYFGTSGFEGVETHQLDVNANDEAVIGMGVDNVELPITTGRTTLNGTRDMYIAILADDGASVVAGRLVGGNGVEGSEGLSVDSSGRVLTGGFTTSTNFPTTPGAHQTTHAGGKYDGIVVALSANLDTILLSTYVGGGGDFDSMRGSVFDELNDAAVTFGQSDSNDFPTTANAYQKTTTGPGDAALARFLLP